MYAGSSKLLIFYFLFFSNILSVHERERQLLLLNMELGLSVLSVFWQSYASIACTVCAKSPPQCCSFPSCPRTQVACIGLLAAPLMYGEVSCPTLPQCQPHNRQSPSPDTSRRQGIRVGVSPSTHAGAGPPPCLWSEDGCCCPGPRGCFGDGWKQSAVVLGCLRCGTHCTIQLGLTM